MKDAAIARLRLRTQRLIGPPADHPVDVVRRLVAVQSQELAVAKWSLGQRSRNVQVDGVDQLLAKGAILRTHLLRPTWHFVLASDLRWLVTLTAPRIKAAMAYYDRKLGLTDATFARSNKLIAKALAAGRHLTRAELAAALQAGGITAQGQRLGHLMMRAELDLVVCSGAARGKQQTYALVDERAPRSARVPRDEALATLARRYFTGHGPATVKDLAWWAGLSGADAKRGLEAAASHLYRLVAGDHVYWMGEPAPGPNAAGGPAGVLLLQGYDEYIIGYGETRRLLNLANLAGQAGVLSSGQVQFTHAIVADGQVVGHWRRAAGADGPVETLWLRRLGATATRSFQAEVARYARFASGLTGVRSVGRRRTAVSTAS
ncbi:MAG: hypothetical protein QOI66_5062 [Myxococcales bacterium]|nr:hypothetical protein [Myxococcales bacterium]